MTKIKKKARPDFALEAALHKSGYSSIAGVDEAGRGPWAGPVVAGAVVLDPDHIPDGLNDSKALSEAAREGLYDEIIATADWAIGVSDVARIDDMNILQASLWAMKEAVGALANSADFVLVDGNKLPEFDVEARPVIKGDAISLSIAAASIVAKVTRDRMMCELDHDFPDFLWAQNKGYGTKAHRDALSIHGVTEHHRRSFKPIKDLI